VSPQVQVDYAVVRDYLRTVGAPPDAGNWPRCAGVDSLRSCP